VAKFSLRRPEEQAKASIRLSLGSVLTFAGFAFLIYQRFSGPEFAVFYGSQRKLAVMLSAAITLLLSVAGLGLGYNSADQRRNEKKRLSWWGFFISASVMVLTLGLFAFFYIRGEQVGK
jgi:hypothetical protein